MLKTFKDLVVWQKAYQLCLNVYRITAPFPNEEKFRLTSQLRRAAVSIPSNIAEGYGRKTNPDSIKFLYVSYGSIREQETQIMLAEDLGYMENGPRQNVLNITVEVERMLKGLITSLENTSSTI